MITLRPSASRGAADYGWLQARYSFSFADYHDKDHLQFRSLRVMNEDRVAPGRGFAPHGHRDMEIITYVLDGALEHKDSTGGGGVITPGMVQYMAAGSGVEHSEKNASQTEMLHLYQIWIRPKVKNATPRYEERRIGPANDDSLVLLASGDGRDNSITINQDADLYAAILSSGQKTSHAFAPGRGGWLQVAKGAIELADGRELTEGDGARIEDEAELAFTARTDSELLLFDLA